MRDITFTNAPPEAVSWSVVSSDNGDLLLGFTKQKQLCRLSFLEKRKPPALIKEWKAQWPHTTFTANEKPQRLTPATSILLVGTDFQHRVWSALLDISEGEVMTYGEMAAHIDKAGAARAVGTALGANPVPLLVPCHRVVAAKGLGGYTGGLEIKRRLLNAEALVPFKARH